MGSDSIDLPKVINNKKAPPKTGGAFLFGAPEEIITYFPVGDPTGSLSLMKNRSLRFFRTLWRTKPYENT